VQAARDVLDHFGRQLVERDDANHFFPFAFAAGFFAEGAAFLAAAAGFLGGAAGLPFVGAAALAFPAAAGLGFAETEADFPAAAFAA
jgi:hypothetical protein